MKTFLIATTAVIALAAPASAQLLGGAGAIGGGLGGSFGGLGGSVGGTLGGTIDSTRAATSAASEASRATRQAERAARRAERSRDRSIGLTGSANTSAMAATGQRSLAVQGNAAAQAALNLPTRGVAVATSRGLRRVSATATGVPVFVSARAVPAPVAIGQTRIAPYPVYSRSAYYGGPDVVFIGGGDVGYYMDRQYRDLSRDIAGTGATVVRRGQDLVVQLPADVTFAFDRSDIQPRFVRTLDAVARSLDTYDATDVEIVGHTDSVGSDSYNLALSERRGRSVADFLVDRSAAPNRLVVEAMGESEPVASNATVSGRAANRRVEIIFHPRVA